MRVLRGYSTAVIPRWFRAVDVPQTKPGIYAYSPKKDPQQFEEFAPSDSSRLEDAFNRVGGRVMVEEDGLFSVDTRQKLCKPTFWDGPGFLVRRSLWFELVGTNKLIPLDADIENKIEKAYQEAREATLNLEWPTKSGSTELVGRFSTKWNNSSQPLLTLTEKRSWLPALGKRVLYRGTPASDSDAHSPSLPKTRPEFRPREIKHLVFCVHGIGQLLSVKFEQVNFVKDVNGLRKAMRSAHSSLKGAGPDSGVQVLPVLWRHRLNDKINGLRPHQLFGTTNLAADAVLDFVMYTEMTQRKQIQSVAADEMNRMYHQFCEANPGFREQPRVSIIGHSLGSVIAYDLVNPETALASLDFDVTNLFTLGSPLGVIDLIRQVPTVTKGAARSLYNIMRLADPIAARLEPLVTPESIKVPPQPLPGGRTNLLQQVRELTGDLATQGEVLSNKASALFQFLSTNESTDVAKEVAKEEAPESKPPSERPDLSRLKNYNRHGRLDFNIKETMDLSLLLGLAGHLMYLDNPDVVQFILKELLEL